MSRRFRFWYGWIGEANFSDVQRAMLPGKRDAGAAALRLMDEHLATRDWFVGAGMTLADIALYPYTHVAEEGGQFRLADYPNVQVWIARVEARAGLGGDVGLERTLDRPCGLIRIFGLGNRAADRPGSKRLHRARRAA